MKEMNKKAITSINVNCQNSFIKIKSFRLDHEIIVNLIYKIDEKFKS
jgi:hypothetical protein